MDHRDADYWDLHARRDPLWAVLSDGGKRDRQWSLDAFMATGEREISLLFHHLDAMGQRVTRGRALDFGCGVGRLTQALGRRFETALGIDISSRMIALAESINCYRETVRYRVHASTDLREIASPPFDFIYSNIVLQHIDPAQTREYLRSFVASLADEGLLVFQLPSERAAPSSSVIAPMPDDAYRGSLRVVAPIETRVAPSSEHRVLVEVVNDSAATWRVDAYGAIRIGNHWLSGGEMVVQDDGRAALPPALEPGAKAVLELTVKAPARAGDYLLEIDIVHEGVTWFGDRGSPALRVPVAVGQAAAQTAGAARVSPPVRYDEARFASGLEPLAAVPLPSDFPMHAIPRPETMAILGEAGGRVEAVEEDDHGRPEWISYRYFVRRA